MIQEGSKGWGHEEWGRYLLRMRLSDQRKLGVVQITLDE